MAGQARHAELEQLVRDGAWESFPPRLRELFAGAKVEAEVPVAWSVTQHRARRLDVEGRDYAPELDEVPGRMDVLVSGDRVAVVDWKGFSDVGDPTTNDQLMFYASCAADLTGASEVGVHVAYVGGVDLAAARVVSRQVDLFDLEAYRATLPRTLLRVREQQGRATPDVAEGEHCRYCPAQWSCPAKAGAVALLAGERLGAELTAASDAKAWLLLDQLEPIVKAARQQIRARAALRPLDLGDGTVLREVVKEGNEELDGAVAHQVAVELLGAEFAEAMCERSTSKAAIRRAAKERELVAAKVERELLEEIRRRGGATRTPTKTIAAVPKDDAR